MKVLLLYPQFPDTFWSFRHALKFTGKRAAQPPLGLMTVAALLPFSWEKRLVDTNVEKLTDRDLRWAEVVFLSGMHVQLPSMQALIARCKKHGLRTVVGGPITNSVSQAELGADHVAVGEAEELMNELARDLEAGTAKPHYEANERPEMTTSPMPDLSLIHMNRYSTMTVQYSRGCPFNCEFCDIIQIYGRVPRTKATDQVLAELDQLYQAGWRGAVFVVDDNFIGNKARTKVLLRAMAQWGTEHGHPFRYITEASLNLADDRELMEEMQAAHFTCVFLGIETPDEQSLAATHKMQNTRRNLLDSVKLIQSYGMEVMGGFILGFDTDREDIFDRMVDFIQQSGIPVAMVGLLQAFPGTQLFHRLQREGRILDSGRGNNTDCALTFLPTMSAEKLLAGYRQVLRRIYSAEAYYTRVRVFLSRRGQGDKNNRALQWNDLRAFARSIVRQGILGRERVSYWRFLFTAATRYRKSFATAMTLAVMGYHFRKMTEEVTGMA